MENLIPEKDKNSKVGEEPKDRKENIDTMEKGTQVNRQPSVPWFRKLSFNLDHKNVFKFVLIFYVISFLAVLLTRKFTIDERATMQIMSYGSNGFLTFISFLAGDWHPPLFYILSYPFFLMGSLYGVKLFSFTCGLITLFAVYDIFRLNSKKFNPKILAAFMFTIPNLTLHFLIARMYGLLLCLEAISLCLSYRLISGRFIKNNYVLHLILLILIRICALYTHYFAIIMIFFNVSLFIVHGFVVLIEKKLKHRNKIIIIDIITAIALGLSIYALCPWMDFQMVTMTGNHIEWGFLGIDGMLNFASFINSSIYDPLTSYSFINYIRQGFNLYNGLAPHFILRHIIKIMVFCIFIYYSILSLKYADSFNKIFHIIVLILFAISYIWFYNAMSLYAVSHYSRYLGAVIFYLLIPLCINDYSGSKLNQLSHEKMLKILILVNMISFISFFIEYYVTDLILTN